MERVLLASEREDRVSGMTCNMLDRHADDDREHKIGMGIVRSAVNCSKACCCQLLGRFVRNLPESPGKCLSSFWLFMGEGSTSCSMKRFNITDLCCLKPKIFHNVEPHADSQIVPGS